MDREAESECRRRETMRVWMVFLGMNYGDSCSEFHNIFTTEELAEEYALQEIGQLAHSGSPWLEHLKFTRIEPLVVNFHIKFKRCQMD